MKLSKPSKKQLLAALLPLVVLVAAGTYAVVVYGNVDNNSPEAKKYKQAAPVVAEPAKEISDADVITPAEILKDPTKYANKDIKIRGRLMEFEKKYQIVNEDTSKPVALPLDTSKTSVDLKGYVYGEQKGTTGNTVQGPVVITGKLVQETSKDKTTLKVVVMTIE